MPRVDLSWPSAALRGLIIFVYFFAATVWLPDLVLQLVAGSTHWIQDLVVLAVWGAGMAAGMWILRVAQGRRII